MPLVTVSGTSSRGVGRGNVPVDKVHSVDIGSCLLGNFIVIVDFSNNEVRDLGWDIFTSDHCENVDLLR